MKEPKWVNGLAKLDSEDGISSLLSWAKAGGFVLNPAHRRLADKYGVSTDGIRFSDPLPVA